MNKLSLGAASAVLTLGFWTLGSASAFAALPAGEHLVTIGCQGENGRLVDVNVDDASGTVIGAPISEAQFQCAVQGAFDPVTGYIYYPQMGDSNVNDALFKTDLDGNQTNLGDFTLNGTAVGNVTSLAIDSSGNAYLFDDAENLYSVDLETAALTLIGTSTVGSSFESLAFDRTTDTLYALRQGGGTVYTVDVSTAALTDTGFDIANYVMGITFDDAGLMWVLTDDVLSELATFDVDSGTVTLIANGDLLNIAGDDYYTQSAVYYGEVTGGGDGGGSESESGAGSLAKTGFDSGVVGAMSLFAVVAGFSLRRALRTR